MFFRDRSHAGQLLALNLLKYQTENPIILALPRGGVPVAAQIADSLGAPLEILAVRKVGAPFNPELALGAVCEDVSPVLSDAILAQIGMKAEELADIVTSEKKEIYHQIQKYRRGKDLMDLTERVVIVIDDGLATGATISAAIKYLKTKAVSKIIVAVPIAAASSAKRIRARVDEFFAVEEIEDLLSVSHWYENFDPVSDREIISLLRQNRHIERPSLNNSVILKPSESMLGNHF